MKKAIIFARCSTTRQEINSQVAETVEYARSLGFADSQLEIIAEVGASAVKLNELYQKTIEKLFSMVASGEYSAVICWHINRLCRNDIYAMRIKEKLIENNVQLYIKEPSLKLLNDDGTVNSGAELAFSLFATMAKQQIEEFKAKSRRARERNKKNKVFNGGKIRIGYTVADDGKYVISDEFSKVIKDIYSLYINDGYSYTQIADEMTERGYEMTYHLVHDILTTTLYHDGEKYPPIITKEEYELTLKKRKANKENQTKQFEYSYFSNRLIRCKCGAGYTVSAGSYRCSCYTEKGEHSGQLSTKWIDGLLWLICSNKEAILQQKQNKNWADEIKAKISVLEAKVNNLNTILAGVENKRSRAAEMYIDGILTKDQYNAKIKSINDGCASDEKKLEEYKNEVVKLRVLMEGNNNQNSSLIQRVKVAEHIQGSDEKQMQKIVRYWLQRVTVGDGYVVTVELIDGSVYRFRYMPKRAVRGSKIHTLDGKPLLVPMFERVNKNLVITRPQINDVDSLVTLLHFINGSNEIV